MTRLERKDRTDIEFMELGVKHGLFDIFDESMKQVWRINDEEYDYLAMNATDEELGYVVREILSISEAKKAIAIVNKYVTLYRESTYNKS